MSQPTYEARRANLEDIPALRQFWVRLQLPEPELEKRFTEFQLALGPDGSIQGAIGLHVERLHGLLHNEAFLDAGLTDVLRPLLWGRVQSVARNRGLVRLWTLESAPYWQGQGFAPANDEMRAQLPPNFGEPTARWATLKLREEVHASLSPDHEFALFRESAKQDSERLLQQAKMMKGVALAVAIVFFLLILTFGIGWVWYVKYKQEHPQGPTPTVAPSKGKSPATNAVPVNAK